MEYLLFVSLLVWLVPWILAVGHGHPRHGSILALTLLLGWTGVGWGVALWWAWPPRPAPATPPLRLIQPAPPVPAPPAPPRGNGTGRVRLRSGVVLCALSLAALAGPALLSRSTPLAGPPHGEVVSREVAPLRAGPGAGFRKVGTLRAPCVVRVFEQSGPMGDWSAGWAHGWKRVWRTAACEGLATGRSEGWIRADFARRTPDT